jgi:hypothetical protein
MSDLCPRHGKPYGFPDGDLLCTRDGCYHASVFDVWRKLEVACEVLRVLGASALANMLGPDRGPPPDFSNAREGKP